MYLNIFKQNYNQNILKKRQSFHFSKYYILLYKILNKNLKIIKNYTKKQFLKIKNILILLNTNIYIIKTF